MKKLLIILGLFLTLYTLSVCFAQQTESIKSAEVIQLEQDIIDLKNIEEYVINHSVSIVSLSGNSWNTCSGVLIKNTLQESIVLTAKHCIGIVEELYVEDILADSVGISFYDDLAYIKLTEMVPNKTSAIISPFLPVKSEFIIVIGYPNLKLHVAIGKMHLKTSDWQIARINIIPGCSGGGVYNKYGELVGIVWGAIGTEEERKDKKTKIGIFERLEDVIDFVNKNKLLE